MKPIRSTFLGGFIIALLLMFSGLSSIAAPPQIPTYDPGWPEVGETYVLHNHYTECYVARPVFERQAAHVAAAFAYLAPALTYTRASRQDARISNGSTSSETRQALYHLDPGLYATAVLSFNMIYGQSSNSNGYLPPSPKRENSIFA